MVVGCAPTYIVIGAGSAGCVLANRLSRDADKTVLLFEAGGRDTNPLIHIPAGLKRIAQSGAYNWKYQTESQSELYGRKLYWPRGKILGGSSSINAMCYIRGQRSDFETWNIASGPGWGFEDLLPYFKRGENQERGADAYHSIGGELSVSDIRYRSPLSSSFVEACNAVGVPYNADFNGSDQFGAGFYQVTQARARRCSTASGYLRPIINRKNLKVKTNCLVDRIDIKNNRAIGVWYRSGTKRNYVPCEGEIILAGGAINSPQLLMHSGIGDAGHLTSLGLPVVLDLPGVGRSLQDHLGVSVVEKSISAETYDFGAFREFLELMRYLVTRGGPASSNAAEAGAFLSSSQASIGNTDIQIHFLPVQVEDHGRAATDGRGFTLIACGLRPLSRGEIRLRSADISDPPIIQPNYLREAPDMAVMIEALSHTADILNTAEMRKFRMDQRSLDHIASGGQSMIDYIRKKAETTYHPCGTCCMGYDSEAVVDSSLRVHGLQGLRVVDASVMPAIVSGNTNAATIMIAEKGSDLILDITAPRPGI